MEEDVEDAKAWEKKVAELFAFFEDKGWQTGDWTVVGVLMSAASQAAAQCGSTPMEMARLARLMMQDELDSTCEVCGGSMVPVEPEKAGG